MVISCKYGVCNLFTDCNLCFDHSSELSKKGIQNKKSLSRLESAGFFEMPSIICPSRYGKERLNCFPRALMSIKLFVYLKSYQDSVLVHKCAK